MRKTMNSKDFRVYLSREKTATFKIAITEVSKVTKLIDSIKIEIYQLDKARSTLAQIITDEASRTVIDAQHAQAVADLEGDIAALKQAARYITAAATRAEQVSTKAKVRAELERQLDTLTNAVIDRRKTDSAFAVGSIAKLIRSGGNTEQGAV